MAIKKKRKMKTNGNWNKQKKVTPNEKRKMVMEWQKIGNKIQWKW